MQGEGIFGLILSVLTFIDEVHQLSSLWRAHEVSSLVASTARFKLGMHTPGTRGSLAFSSVPWNIRSTDDSVGSCSLNWIYCCKRELEGSCKYWCIVGNAFEYVRMCVLSPYPLIEYVEGLEKTVSSGVSFC